MNILFLSISTLPKMNEHSISLDLLREFKNNGHNIYVICACGELDSFQTRLEDEYGIKVLRVKIGGNKKANLIRKGLTTLMLPYYYKKAIKRYYSNIKFDLILYPTPPVTFSSIVEYVKKRDGAIAYLMLKDIFPQNAIDLGILSKSGIRSIVYWYFRWHEKKLYRVSDYIGCMSEANVNYVLKHNPEIHSQKLEVCPNSIEPIDLSINWEKKKEIRKKYHIPLNKIVFVYGGNLGKPQGIPFLIDCLRTVKETRAFFLIVGDGTEFSKLEYYVKNDQPPHVMLMKRLPKDEYDTMIGSCDVGLIFLDHRFSIPNFPSRLLSYMQAKLPVLAVTDTNTDIGKVIVEGGFGWWSESDSCLNFKNRVEEISASLDTSINNQKSQDYLIKNYNVKNSYNTIIKHVNQYIQKN